MRLNSLELNWIRKHDKSISIPEIVFTKLDVSGCYYAPVRRELLLNETFVPLDKGLILVDLDDDAAESIIVHEWRHHWQHLNGQRYDGVSWSFQDDYDKELLNYFRYSKQEYDALIFQLRYSSSKVNEVWKEILEPILPKNI